MDMLLAEMLASLREGHRAIDAEVQPLLQAEAPDWPMLERLRDVADEYAGRARVVRHMMSKAGAGADDPDALEEVERLCTYFERTAALIAQQTGDTDDAPSTNDEAGRA
jgi:hypothetical protein